MKTCGHTMGTPDLNVLEAIEFFSELGHDGIEIRCESEHLRGCHLDPDKFTKKSGRVILETAESWDIEIACLTPYNKDFISPGKREREIEGLKKVVEIADFLGSQRVRVYGGTLPPKGLDREKAWNLTVGALQEISTAADSFGVFVCVENHMETLTETARDTVQLVQDVDSDAVKILYDQTNINRIGGESMEAAIALQKDYIFHVHVKDQRFERNRRITTLLGEGTVDWRKIVEGLRGIGYEGYLSDEYEKHWVPELPEPEIGMSHNLQYIRGLLEHPAIHLG